MRRASAVVAALAVLAAAGCSAKSNGTSAGSGGTGNSSNAAVSSGTAAATAGDSSASSAVAGSSTSASSSCSPALLKTKSAGRLTVATDSPAYPPWFVDNKPSNGKGFESAVAYAVAKKLGYSSSQVSWVTQTFDSAVAPTSKKFDFDINEFSITPARAKIVDFSSGYYDVAQAVVVLKGSKYAHATTIAALKGAKLAAQEGTTSYDAITNVIKPDRTPSEYPSNDLAVAALKNGQVDGLVVDLPTAFYVTSAQVQNSVIAGQLPTNGKPEQFGLLLEKDSPITSCVTQAVDALRASGTLEALKTKWLTTAGNAPVLK